MMDRRTFLGGLTFGILSGSLAGEAQQAGKIYRIGMLRTASPDVIPFAQALEKGLRDHGYILGQNVVIESRITDGSATQMAVLYAELARLNVDVFVVFTDRAALAVRQITTRIPIVVVTAEDPIGTGLAQSLSRPGGNVTGLTIVAAPEIYGKNLELLSEVLPKGANIAVLYNPEARSNQTYLKVTTELARQLRVKLSPVEARTSEDLEPAFARIAHERAAGLIILGEILFYVNYRRVNHLVMQTRIACIWPTRQGAEAGGLMSYGPDVLDQFQRAAAYVDKIFKGANPGDLPMEQPTKFDLVVNLKTAKALGLTIPPSLLLRAAQVIQ